MAEPFIGEIRVFAGNFAPKGWAFCNGQLLPIQQYAALFTVLGITYGGDGRTNFALPNLMDAAPIHQGAGSGLTPRTLGEALGAAGVTLNIQSMPAHAHLAQASTGQGTTNNPSGNVFSETPSSGGHGGQVPMYSPTSASLKNMNAQALSSSGGDQPHNNMQPYLSINFIIALQGIFPSRG